MKHYRGRVLYALAGLPLALVGVAYVVLVAYVGGLLSVTLVGLPVVAAGLRGARLLGGPHRALARSLLGVAVEAPPPLPGTVGVLAWIKAGLADVAAWRAVLYLLVRFPAAVLGFLAMPGLPVAGCWLIGVSAWLLTTRPEGAPPAWLTASAATAGLAALAATPWAVRVTAALNGRLARTLLGPTEGQRNLRRLRIARGKAVAEHTRSLRQIERDLHDGTQAELVTIAMTLALAADRLRDSGDDRGRELVGRARSQTGKAIAELRRLIDGFSPAALDDGLAEALRVLAAEAAIPVTLRAEVSEEVDEAIERTAYFCAVELLTNVAKHSGARSTTVDVGTAGNVLRLRVVDDGRGGAGVGAGTGLLGLRERLAAVDGTLTVRSPVGGPTTVDVTLPARL